MQPQEEIFEGSDIDHQALIMKGKRAKRQRSSSPFGLTVTSSSSSACGGDGSSGGGVAEEYNSISSPVTSGEIYESTEEEEDMANCLIMLAQSNGPKRSHIGKKFEMVTSTNKADFSAYECKTCNRSFQSFQALGGHRASHKKPKGAMADEKKPLVLAVKDHHVEDADQFNRENPAVLALQVSNSTANCHGNKGHKVHECSICGSEFSSGQALGGHMRRHRAVAAAATSSPIESRNGDGIKRRNVLLLDLNLPAPEDDLRDSKFQFGAPRQAIVFSTPALVDCHY